MIDHSHLSTNEAFVADLFDNAIDVYPIDIDTARADLEMFRREWGDSVPADLTAEEYMEILNRFCDEAGHILDAYGHQVDMDSAAELMDDDIREELHATITPCTNQAFFDEYCKRHLAKYGEQFVVN